MRKPITINGFVWYIGLEAGDITLWKDENSTQGYSLYSGFITMDERKQIKESKAYKELFYGISLD